MKKSSLKIKIWLYLSIFAFLIIGLIWFLQIISLNIYYEWNKTSEIKTIASKITDIYNTESYKEQLDNISFEKNICIQLAFRGNILYSTDSDNRGCIDNSRKINDYKLKFMTSNEDFITYKFINPKFKNKTILHGLKLNEEMFAFITTSLEPINSTVLLLKKQFIYIIILVLFFAFLIGYIISKKISRPIEQMTLLSKEISKGNYNIVLNSKSGINEITDLENSLNNMSMELSKTENLRRELLANISHDLKTPLTLIKANAEIVKDLTYSSKEKRERNLNTIVDEVDKLNLLVEDILDLSKMQSNALILNMEKFNLNELIKSIIKRFDILVEKDKYEINYNGFDAFISADKKKIEQVIYNLINNAINYTGNDKKVYIKLVNKKDYIRVEVIDTGDGIDKKDIKYIWDKYYKVDKKYKRVTYGTGLGLSIVKNILNIHGFNYGVYSKENKGTKFYFDVKKQKM